MNRLPLVLNATWMLLALDYLEFVDLARGRSQLDFEFHPVAPVNNPRNFDHTKAKDTLLRFGIQWTNRSDALKISRFMQKLLRRATANTDFDVEADPVIEEMVACGYVHEFVMPTTPPARDLTNPGYAKGLRDFISAIASGDLTESDLQ